ncbi:hypothetical protein [Paenibacillus dokdonensis]|uniref:hypothetical protein n=1 Tax=Paenibacillus dokdonensis TaxID=2567944 RepID=UPI0010A81CAD|nr:hypothetical protein [Paenibacillus dokdonensis]
MEAYYNCRQCMNRKVRILTRDGMIHEGKIVNVDRNNVYLETERRGNVTTSAFGPYGGFGYGNQVLTLSLFTLLAIALI